MALGRLIKDEMLTKLTFHPAIYFYFYFKSPSYPVAISNQSLHILTVTNFYLGYDLT